ncbi:MAG: hypothetical protein ACOCUH_02640 [Bacteriovoracia bacterium]
MASKQKVVNLDSNNIVFVFNQGILKTLSMYKILDKALEDISKENIVDAANKPLGEFLVLKMGEVKVSDEVVAKKQCKEWLLDRTFEQVFVSVMDSLVAANTLLDLLSSSENKMELDDFKAAQAKFVFGTLILRLAEL